MSPWHAVLVRGSRDRRRCEHLCLMFGCWGFGGWSRFCLVSCRCHTSYYCTSHQTHITHTSDTHTHITHADTHVSQSVASSHSTQLNSSLSLSLFFNSYHSITSGELQSSTLAKLVTCDNAAGFRNM